MKQPYNWDYTIRIKTKEGTYEYEKENVLEAVKMAEQHPDYEELYIEHKKPLVKTKRLNRNMQPRNKGLKK